MRRKLLGTALVLFFLYIIVVIARDSLPLDDWVTRKGHHHVPPGGSESEG